MVASREGKPAPAVAAWAQRFDVLFAKRGSGGVPEQGDITAILAEAWPLLRDVVGPMLISFAAKKVVNWLGPEKPQTSEELGARVADAYRSAGVSETAANAIGGLAMYSVDQLTSKKGVRIFTLTRQLDGDEVANLLCALPVDVPPGRYFLLQMTTQTGMRVVLYDEDSKPVGTLTGTPRLSDFVWQESDQLQNKPRLEA